MGVTHGANCYQKATHLKWQSLHNYNADVSDFCFCVNYQYLRSALASGTVARAGRNHYRACRSMKVAADNPPKDEAEWRHQAVAYVHGLLALNDLVFTCAVSGDSIGDSI